MVLSWPAVLLGAVCVFAAVPGVANAQMSGDQAAAKVLADKGYDLLQAGLHAEALDLFRKAEERYHSPMFVLFMAECEEKLGRLVSARQRLVQVAREEVGPHSSSAFVEARQGARRRLLELEPRIPRITVRVLGADARSVRMKLDARAVPAEELDAPILLDPGDHRLIATDADGQSTEQAFSLKESESQEITLAFEARSEPSLLPPAIAYGVGGAALVVGAITGGVFAARAGDLKGRCSGNVCPLELEEEGSEVRALGDVTTAMLVLGGVGVAAGTALLFVPFGDGGAVVDVAGLAGAREGVGLELGLGHLGLHGRF